MSTARPQGDDEHVHISQGDEDVAARSATKVAVLGPAVPASCRARTWAAMCKMAVSGNFSFPRVAAGVNWLPQRSWPPVKPLHPALRQG
jgi:hypothetical protein